MATVLVITVLIAFGFGATALRVLTAQHEPAVSRSVTTVVRIRVTVLDTDVIVSTTMSIQLRVSSIRLDNLLRGLSEGGEGVCLPLLDNSAAVVGNSTDLLL